MCKQRVSAKTVNKNIFCALKAMTTTQTGPVSIKNSSMLYQKPVVRQTKVRVKLVSDRLLYHMTIRTTDSLPPL